MSEQPLDLVIGWVDGNDTEWRKMRESALQSLSWTPEKTATSEVRCSARDDLKFCLRSVEKFAPFFRHIYIVTDCRLPSWLVAEHPKIRVVSHREIFPSQDALPNFNSLAIEAYLDRIPGLSENFVYANDDNFFCAPVLPSDFVTADGRAKVRLTNRPLFTPKDYTESLYQDLEANTVKALESKLGRFFRGTYSRAGKNFFKNLVARIPTRGVWNRPAHVAQVLNKTSMKEAREHFKEEFEHLARHPFRHRSLIWTLTLMSYFAIWKGKAEAVPDFDSVFLTKGMSSNDFVRERNRLLQANQRGLKLACLNDGESESNFDWYLHSRELQRALFPAPSSFEIKGSSPSTSPASPHPISTPLAAYAAYRAAS